MDGPAGGCRGDRIGGGWEDGVNHLKYLRAMATDPDIEDVFLDHGDAYFVGRNFEILMFPEVDRLIKGSPVDQEDAREIFKGLFQTAYNKHHEAETDEERSILTETMKGICRLQVAVDKLIEGR